MKNTTSETNAVPIRHMKFDFDESKAAKYCWNNNSWGSAYILTFSAFIPAGERFVVEAVRAFRDEIDDPELKAQVTSLIGQEANHSRVHAEFNAMYDLKGMPVSAMARMSEKVYLELLMPRIPRTTRLAIACAIEHITAIMAEKAFGDELAQLEMFDEITGEFLLWHLLEELEHKSIAYDLYEHVDGRYLHRLFAFVLIWSLSVPLGLYSVRQMLKVPGFNQGKRKNRRGSWYFARDFFSSSSKLFSYFRPGFHPGESDTDDMLLQWREALFGKDGSLNKHVTKVVFPKVRKMVTDAAQSASTPPFALGGA